MNVLFFADGKRPRAGGVTNYVELLFSHFDRRHVVPHDWNLWTGTSFGPVSPPSFSLNWYRKLKIASTILLLPAIIRKARIDIVHLNPSLQPRALSRDIAIAQRCKNIGIPFVVFFRGWDKSYETHLDREPEQLARLVERLGAASAVIVLATEFKDTLVRWGFDAKKISIETTAVDDRMLADSDIVTRFGTRSEERFNILFLSRIEKAKGVYVAIETYRLLKEKYPFAMLTIAGDGMELSQVKQYVTKAGIRDIEFLGWVDAKGKRKAYLEADMYLFPTSWGEGMPNSVLEAMAFGLPVVTRPVGGLADFFEDGRMGAITDSIAPEVFVKLCERYVADPRLKRETGAYNRVYATERFLASKVAKRIEAIYRTALARH